MNEPLDVNNTNSVNPAYLSDRMVEFLKKFEDASDSLVEGYPNGSPFEQLRLRFEYTGAKHALTHAIASLEADRDRMDTAQRLLLGADFEWGEDSDQVVMLRIPAGVRTGSNFRQFLDDAKFALPQGTPTL